MVITGATSGLGAAAARQLAPWAGTLVLVGRRPEALEASVRELAGRRPGAAVCGHLADLSLLAQVRRVGTEIAAAHPRLDVAVQNAGAYFARREETAEGVERTFALNVLAPYYLTELWQGPLAAGAPSRVVMVDSAAHHGHTLRLDDLEARRRYGGFSVYGRSKLALLMLSFALAARLRPQRTDVNAVHPGFVRSGFGRNNPGLAGAAVGFAAWLGAISPDAGAARVVQLAREPGLSGTTGAYFEKGRPVPGNPAAYDAGATAQLVRYCDARIAALVGPAP